MQIIWEEFTSEPIRHPVSRERFEVLRGADLSEFKAGLELHLKEIRAEKIRKMRLKLLSIYFFLVVPLLGILAIIFDKIKVLPVVGGGCMVVAFVSAFAFIPIAAGTILTIVNIFNLSHQVEAQYEGLYKKVQNYHSYDQYVQFEVPHIRNGSLSSLQKGFLSEFEVEVVQRAYPPRLEDDLADLAVEGFDSAVGDAVPTPGNDPVGVPLHSVGEVDQGFDA